MSLTSLVTPIRARLRVPTEEELAALQPTHQRLRVTDDYVEVLRQGLLPLDLNKVIPPGPAAKEAMPFWARDVASLARAQGVDAEELPEVLNSVFYLVGDTYGGGLLVQINQGELRGKLATIPDSAIPSFELAEVQVPDQPIVVAREADAYLRLLEQSHVLRLHDLDLAGFLELRLRSLD